METTPAPPFKIKVLKLIRENVRKRKISPRHETEAILPKVEKIDIEGANKCSCHTLDGVHSHAEKMIGCVLIENM